MFYNIEHVALAFLGIGCITLINNSELTFEIRIFKVYHRCSYFFVLMFISKKGVPKLFFKYVYYKRL